MRPGTWTNAPKQARSPFSTSERTRRAAGNEHQEGPTQARPLNHASSSVLQTCLTPRRHTLGKGAGRAVRLEREEVPADLGLDTAR